MNELIVFTSIMFASLLGYVLIRAYNLLPKEDLLFSIGCSFGLGVGLLFLQMYSYSRFGIAWHIQTLILPWLLILGIVTLIKRKSFHFSLSLFPQLTYFEKFLCVGIFLTCCYVLFEVLLRPLGVWDGWATWLFEAKVFFIDGKISATNLQYMQASYPLLYPLFATFVYEMMGHVDDTAILLISTAFYGFLSLSFFASLRRSHGLTYSLFGTLLLMTLQNLIRHGGRIEAGIADLPQGYYFFICTMLYLRYLTTTSHRLFFLLCTFLGFSTLVKNEGTPFLLIMTILGLYHIYKHKMYSHLLYLLIPCGLLLEWVYFKKISGVDQIYSVAHHFELSLGKVVSSITGTFKEFVTIKSWNFLWIMYFYLLVFSRPIKEKLVNLHGIILFQLGCYLVVYFTTFGNGPESSIPRLLIHIAPIALFIILSQIKDISWFTEKKKVV